MLTLVLAATLVTASAEPVEYPYSDTMTSQEVTACEPTFCENWKETEGGLLCLDSDELYPPGHYFFDYGPDDGELQAIVEY